MKVTVERPLVEPSFDVTSLTAGTMFERSVGYGEWRVCVRTSDGFYYIDNGDEYIDTGGQCQWARNRPLPKGTKVILEVE